MRRHLNLRQIEAFKAVIENGTLSRAAEALHISQPAMSRLVAHLEFDTGLRLFDRVKGRLVPTGQAQRLHEQVGRIFAGVRQVENAVEAIRREERGNLSVAVIAPLAGSFIQRVTSSFMAKRREVFCSVEMLSSQRTVERLIAQSIDIGLVSGAFDNPYVTFEPLMEHPLVCIMPPDHPLAEKSVIEPADLHETAFVGFHSNTYFAALIDRSLENVSPSIMLTTDVAPTLCEFVAAGLGVSLVHPLMVSGFGDRIAVRRFAPDILFTFQLARTADSCNPQLVQAYAEEIRRIAGDISTSMATNP